MITYLIVDKLPAEPGIYGVSKSGKDLKEIVKFKPSDFLLTNILTAFPYLEYRLIKGAYDYFKGSKLGKKQDILPKENIIGNPDELDIISQNIIILNTEYFKNNYKFYNDKLFNGVFKKKYQLESILPKNKNAELIIITKKDAKAIFINSGILEDGLYIAGDENKKLYPLSRYVKDKWDEITTSFLHIYSHLGAINIAISDKTSNKIDIKAEFKKAGLDIANFDFKSVINRKFDLKDKVNETLYEPDKVRGLLFKLDEVPHIKQKAFELIQRRTTGSFSCNQEIDVKFGLSVEIAGTFSGIFEGGYRRELEVNVEFG